MFFPDDSVPPPPLKKKGRTMPPEDPNDRAGMMEWLRQVPPPGGVVKGGPPPVPQELAGPFTKVESIQAPAPKRPAASPLGVGAGRVKELDDMLMKRVADTAPVPAPQSPYERDVTEGLPAIRAVMGNQVGHMDRRGGNFVPGLADRPEDIAFRRAMEAHQIDAAQKMAQRQALTGAMEVAPKMLPGEAEASKVAFMQSPEGAMQMAVSGMLAGGLPPDQIALAVPQMKNLPGFAPKAVPGQPQGPPPPMDPITALSAANPHFLASVYDPKTKRPAMGEDGKEIGLDKFLSKAYAVEGGKFMQQNWPALQEYANTNYGPNSVNNLVTSPTTLQWLESSSSPFIPMLNMSTPQALGLAVEGVNPFSAKGQEMAAQSQAVPLPERFRSTLGMQNEQDKMNAMIRALMRNVRSPASGQAPTGQPPPLPHR